MSKLNRLESRLSIAPTRKPAEFSFNRITGRPLGKIRRRIALRDLYTCRRCGMVVSEFEIDHIVPLFVGGCESDENRQLLCRQCHIEKTLEDEKLKGGGNG